MLRYTLGFIAILLFSFSGFSQVTRVEYCFDNDYTSVQSLPVSLVENYTFNANLDVSTLSEGLHVVHVRFLDNQGHWSLVKSSFFRKTSEKTPQNALIEGFEYWFDFDYASAQTHSLSPLEQFSWNENLDISTLENGLHSISYRVHDDHGNWSCVVSKYFRKTSEIAVQPATLDACQYWFDFDFSGSQLVDISGNTNFLWSDILNVNTMNNGLHSLSFRIQDDQGNWSSVVTKYFRKKIINNTPTIVEIESVEYWWDNEDDNSSEISLSGTNVNWVESLDMVGLDEGLHLLSFRFKDTESQWSVAESKFLRIISPIETAENNEIIKFRYWVNDAFDEHVEMNLSDVNSDYILLENIPLQSISEGAYAFRYQFADSLGQWSVPMMDSIDKLAYPWIAIQFLETEYCGEGQFEILYDTADVTNISWDFGDGNLYEGFDPIHAYTETGSFHPSVIAHHETTAQSVTYTITDSIQVFPVFQSDSIRSICNGDSVLFQGSYYHESGIYHANYNTIHGCDSIISLDLSLNPYDSISSIEAICEGDSVLFEGQYFSIGGTYYSAFTNQFNCDSVQILNLTVNPRPETPVIVQDMDTLYTDEHSTHHWYYDNQLIDGQQDSSLVCAASGNYFVIVENEFSCLSDSSDVITVILSQLEKQETITASLYPNPVNNYLYVELNFKPNETMNYSLIDINGRVIEQGFLFEQRTQLDLTQLAANTYVFVLHYKGKTHQVKIVKQ